MASAQPPQQWMMSAPPQPAAPSAAYQPYHQPATAEEVRTLWIGDLQYWADESYLQSCFAHTNEVLSIKIIRNKITGQPEGYGFIEFVSHAAAERVLQSYNGALMPGTEQTFRLNWASFGMGEKRHDAGPDHSIFVGDLAPDVTDYLLQETFRLQYSSVRGAKVVTDPNTGRSKGYGFVKFADENERNRAMSEMNGVYCSSRPMRISAATQKKNTGVSQQYGATRAYTPSLQSVPVDSDINNTTVFVGNLDLNATEDELRQVFMPLGELIYAKITAGRGFGFVQYATRASAEEAIQRLQGTIIGQQPVRLSWGRSPTAKQELPGGWSQQVDPTQWSSTYYGYGQGYDAYAYSAAQDPSYAYGAYNYAQYPSQVDGTHEMVAAVPTIEPKEDLYDPLATPDVDKLNAAYVAIHGNTILGRNLWMKTCSLPQKS
ncbi:hypothetical protein QQ045_032063 [Rhodiola kirilowii]